MARPPETWNKPAASAVPVVYGSKPVSEYNYANLLCKFTEIRMTAGFDFLVQKSNNYVNLSQNVERIWAKYWIFNPIKN